MILIAAEWIVYVTVVLGALLSGVTLVAALGVAAPVALKHRVTSGAWPGWAGGLGATLAIAGTIAIPLGGWIGYVATR